MSLIINGKPISMEVEISLLNSKARRKQRKIRELKAKLVKPMKKKKGKKR